METDLEKLDFGEAPDAPPPPSATYLALLEWFREQGWNYDTGPSHSYADSTIRLKDCAVRVKCQVYDEDDWKRLNVAAVYQSYVPENRRQAAAEAVARINYSIAVGTFDLDFRDGELSARNWHLSEINITQEMIDRTIHRALNLAQKYHAALMAVAYGGASPTDILEMANGNSETVQ